VGLNITAAICSSNNASRTVVACSASIDYGRLSSLVLLSYIITCRCSYSIKTVYSFRLTSESVVVGASSERHNVLRRQEVMVMVIDAPHPLRSVNSDNPSSAGEDGA